MIEIQNLKEKGGGVCVWGRGTGYPGGGWVPQDIDSLFSSAPH